MASGQVQQGRFEALRIIPKEAQPCVARMAEQSTDAVRQVVMVHDEVRDAFWSHLRLRILTPADGASSVLGLQHVLVGIQGHSVQTTQTVCSLDSCPLFWMVFAPFLDLCSRRLRVSLITLPGSLLRQLRILLPPLPSGLGFLLPPGRCFRCISDMHMIIKVSKDYRDHLYTH